jgi:voltage-gated potassium channel
VPAVTSDGRLKLGLVSDTGHRAGRMLAQLLVRKPLTPLRAARIIATYTVAVTLAAGIVGRLSDSKDFHSLGAGLWWALQTVTTVGYGDIVPRGTGGRVIGAIVMVSGIGFLTVITATVTAAFVEAARHRLGADAQDDLAARLDEIATRLAAIEGGLAAPGESRHDPREDQPRSSSS